MKNLFFPIVMASLRGKPYLMSGYVQGKRTLDLGCGGGDLLCLNPESAYGIDINMQALTNASRKKLKVVCASVTQIPFKTASFTSVNCDNLIEHLFPDQAYMMLCEIARILKKGGHLILSTPYATRAFWRTFSHKRPYPPQSLLKLTGEAISQEDYPSLNRLRPIAIHYQGWFFRNRLLFFLSTLLANIMPPARKSYIMFFKRI